MKHTQEKTLSQEKNYPKQKSLSFLGAIPFGNFFKAGKHLKNGQKIFKAADRASKLGKIKNAVKFAGAGGRAMSKAGKVQNIVKNTIKGINAVFKQSNNDDE